jgi:hypothetical protein
MIFTPGVSKSKVFQLFVHIVPTGTIDQILPDDREKIAALTVYFSSAGVTESCQAVRSRDSSDSCKVLQSQCTELNCTNGLTDKFNQSSAAYKTVRCIRTVSNANTTAVIKLKCRLIKLASNDNDDVYCTAVGCFCISSHSAWNHLRLQSTKFDFKYKI